MDLPGTGGDETPTFVSTDRIVHVGRYTLSQAGLSVLQHFPLERMQELNLCKRASVPSKLWFAVSKPSRRNAKGSGTPYSSSAATPES
jgi:hypothetical protein